jgi:hypothetical protein
VEGAGVVAWPDEEVEAVCGVVEDWGEVLCCDGEVCLDVEAGCCVAGAVCVWLAVVVWPDCWDCRFAKVALATRRLASEKPNASLGMCVTAFTSRCGQYTPVYVAKGCSGGVSLNHYDVKPR